MSGRIVLLDHGRIVQDGAPQDLFDRPQSRFVADFMGIENVLEGRVTDCRSGATIVAIDGTEIVGHPIPGFAPAAGEKVFLAIRAERLRISARAAPSDENLNAVRCDPRLRVYKGNHYDTELETPIGTLVCRQVDAGQVPETGYAIWDPRHCVIGPLDSATRQS